jgi:hypothetical protein
MYCLFVWDSEVSSKHELGLHYPLPKVFSDRAKGGTRTTTKWDDPQEKEGGRRRNVSSVARLSFQLTDRKDTHAILGLGILGDRDR